MLINNTINTTTTTTTKHNNTNTTNTTSNTTDTHVNNTYLVIMIVTIRRTAPSITWSEGQVGDRSVGTLDHY